MEDDSVHPSRAPYRFPNIMHYLPSLLLNVAVCCGMSVNVLLRMLYVCVCFGWLNG